METPCIQVCVIDPETELCSGCGRTRMEIARWTSMTPEERRAIMETLAQRKQMVEA